MNALANRFLRAASLVVTDRRWAAPLSAMALGFGLFIGVAIGPNAAGTLAGVAPIVEVPDFSGGTSEGGGEGGGSSGALAGAAEGGSGGEGGGGLGALSSAPLASAPIESTPTGEPAPKPAKPKPAEEPAASEETVALKGVVVGANQAAGSYALAIKGGELVSVHAAKLPPPGTKMSLTAGRLANDTFGEAEPRELEGTTKSARFRGAVTFSDPDPAAPTYTVSGRGASLPIHVRPDPSAAAPQLPAVGSYATVTVEIEPKAGAASSETLPPPVPSAAEPPASTAAAAPVCGPDPGLLTLKAFTPAAQLWQGKLEVEGEPSTYVDLAGIVSAVCPSEGKLLISADGMRESGKDQTLTVPAKIDTGKLVIGNSILATATIEPDGSLTLAGLAGDEGLKGADDSSSAQGDLKR